MRSSTGFVPPCASHAALNQLGSSGKDFVSKLPALAEACMHYAVAMRCVRMMPEAMRAHGPEALYGEFESHARLHGAIWLGLGQRFKAYGFHLWSNMPLLFRRWGCLELICQTPVEGMIGKIGRRLPHIQTHVCGRYKEEVKRKGPEARLAVLEARRAGLDSPAKQIYDDLFEETMAAEHEHLPSKRHETRMTQREICLKTDALVAAGKALPGAQYRAEHCALAIVSTVTIKLLACHLVKKEPKAREHIEALMAEHMAYYRAGHLPPTTLLTAREAAARSMAARKAWYHRKGMRKEGRKKGVYDAGRELAYQRYSELSYGNLEKHGRWGRHHGSKYA